MTRSAGHAVPVARATRERASSWPAHGRLGPAGLALVELLADAQDRPQADLGAAQQLAADERVGLALVAAALRVADDRPGGQAGTSIGAEISPV